MDKLNYLIRTLSRTKRKNFENYVVNAVWNRLADPEVKPVTQQHVSLNTGERRFIDLYFPQVNVGVECNEAHHLHTVEEDQQRAVSLYDVLSHVKLGSDYIVHNVDAFDEEGSLRSLREVDDAIDGVVEQLRLAIKQKRDSGTFVPWTTENADPVKYVQSRDVLTVQDDVEFGTIKFACNALFGTNAPIRTAGFIPKTLRNLYGDEYDAWFPQDSKVQGTTSRGGWRNLLSEDGTVLNEYHEERNVVDNTEGQKRIVFLKSRNPVTGKWAYRFAGVFLRKGTIVEDGIPMKHHVLIANHFPVIHAAP